MAEEPPNYLGFRFGGKLQQARQVDEYEVHDRPWDEIPGLAGKTDWDDDPHYFYGLGPPIEPVHEVKMGKLWPNARVWAALDQGVGSAPRITASFLSLPI